MSAMEMASAALLGRGTPIRIDGKVSTSTKGIVSFSDAGDERTRKRGAMATIPLSVPVDLEDNALIAGRDYAVRGIRADQQFVKRLVLEEKADARAD